MHTDQQNAQNEYQQVMARSLDNSKTHSLTGCGKGTQCGSDPTRSLTAKLGVILHELDNRVQVYKHLWLGRQGSSSINAFELREHSADW